MSVIILQALTICFWDYVTNRSTPMWAWHASANQQHPFISTCSSVGLFLSDWCFNTFFRKRPSFESSSQASTSNDPSIFISYTFHILCSIYPIVFPLALQPNSGLGRLHETFCFTSVTKSRTVGRTPWTVDQLVSRPLPVHNHRKTHTQHTH
jgi:hypothetical protein